MPEIPLLQNELTLQAQIAALEQENSALRATLVDSKKQSSSAAYGSSSPPASADRLLQATAIAANTLLSIANFDEAVNTALRVLGEALGSDRINVIENFDSPSESSPHWRVLYEWNSPGTVPQFSDLAAAQGSYREIPELFEQLQQGRSLSYLLEEAPEPFRSSQATIGVKSTQIVPVYVEGKWWGVIGLDDCRQAKRRSPAELSVLKIAADCIGSAIQRERTQQTLLLTEQARSAELERTNSDFQQAMTQLAESEERFRILFELSSEGFYYVEIDPPCPITLPVEKQCEWLYHNIRVTKTNPAFAAMYGVNNPEDLIGVRNADVHVPDSEKNAAFIRGIVESGYRFRNVETEEVDRQGRLRYFLNSGVSTVQDGYVAGGWGTQVDITELRETQQIFLQAEQARAAELAAANEALKQRDCLLSVVAEITKDLLE
ncbi:MAG: PAS domain S-box protein, partial [Cyanobacteria bacterium Co-bin8]|nr:PAS domain S-box protein [Cyanobacteria bacterium Co-bin8]